jgi:hypothetical protein
MVFRRSAVQGRVTWTVDALVEKISFYARLNATRAQEDDTCSAPFLAMNARPFWFKLREFHDLKT